MGERLDEAAATGFVVGVGDLAAVDHDRGLDRELVRELDDLRLQRRRGRDHLEGRARRLRAGEGDPRQRQHRAVAGVQHGDAAVLAAQRRDRALLEARIDRRVHRLSRDGLAAGEHPPAAGRIGAVARDRDQLAARPPGEASVEGELEAAGPGGAAGRESEARELAVLLGGGRGDRSRDALGGRAKRRGAARGRPLGQRRPVAGQDRGALGDPRAPHEPLFRTRAPGRRRFGAQATLSPASGRTRRPESCPKAWVSRLTGTTAARWSPDSASEGSPVVTLATVAVSWASP